MSTRAQLEVVMDQITFDYVMAYGFTFVAIIGFVIALHVSDGRKR
jgi:hypothetical protein